MYINLLHSFTQNNDLSDSEVVIIAVCVSVGVIIIGKKNIILDFCFYSCSHCSHCSDFDRGCNDEATSKDFKW